MELATIAAIATPPGNGGIGIIRISGAESHSILSAIFRPSGESTARAFNCSSGALLSHRLYLGHILEACENVPVDEVLAVVMRAPHSYTKEDVVEIQSHSGYVVINRILKLILANGARLAHPGEFTRRAFMNGRIDLTQAEAVIDIINARTSRSLDIAAEQMKGELGAGVNHIRDTILSVLAEIEAEIEFSDDIDGSGMGPHWAKVLRTGVVEPMNKLIDAHEQNHYFREGMRMAIVGRPNVGKSSLLNRLIRKERAIVTEIPGTTRDSIEEMINIQGLPVIVIDTAGLHKTTQKIELLGIERTHATIQAADIVLLVVDLSQGVTPADQEIFQRLGENKHIIVMNKVDVRSDIMLPLEWEQAVAVKVSALEGTHIDALKDAIFAMGVGPQSTGTSSFVPNLRQAEGLKRAQNLVQNVLLNDRRDLGLTALDLQGAAGELDNIVGSSYSEDVLDRIFNRFCIGK